MTLDQMATARLIDRLLGLPHNRDFAAIDEAIAYVRENAGQSDWAGSSAQRIQSDRDESVRETDDEVWLGKIKALMPDDWETPA